MSIGDEKDRREKVDFLDGEKLDFYVRRLRLLAHMGTLQSVLGRGYAALRDPSLDLDERLKAMAENPPGARGCPQGPGGAGGRTWRTVRWSASQPWVHAALLSAWKHPANGVLRYPSLRQ